MRQTHNKRVLSRITRPRLGSGHAKQLTDNDLDKKQIKGIEVTESLMCPHPASPDSILIS